MSAHDELVRAQARVGTVLRGKYRLDRVLGNGSGELAVVLRQLFQNAAGKRFSAG